MRKESLSFQYTVRKAGPSIGFYRVKSDYQIVKISLTTGLGSYPDHSGLTSYIWNTMQTEKCL